MNFVKEIRLTRPNIHDPSYTDMPVGVIRTGGYRMNLRAVKLMVEEARATFPDLRDENIEMVVYGGDRLRGMKGIEFELSEYLTEAPEGWQVIKELEKAL